ncbi:MAG: hypothetical protein GVY23_02115 [Spirochaetes bacterium]|jgi:predicted anti-sigma-YlaC factor YlaD|nr:hypothetical protein [Spirochaetota bacterium]
MTCNEIERRLLERDHDEALSPKVVAHLRECPRCRRLAKTLEVAEGDLMMASEAGADPDLVSAVMMKVEKSEVYPARTHSLTRWLFGGLWLVTALLAVRQSDPFRFLLGSVVGPRVDLSVMVVTGFGVVAYLAVFVIANGDRLEEMVHNLVRRSGPGRS